MENSIDKPDWTKECCGETWNLNHVLRCLKCGNKLREPRKFPKKVVNKEHVDTKDTNDNKGGFVQ